MSEIHVQPDATKTSPALPGVVDAAWWRQHRERIRPTSWGGLCYDPSVPLRPEPDGGSSLPTSPPPDERAFDAVVGRGDVIKRLDVQVRGNAARGRLFPNVLFTGQAGTGPAELATALARRLGARLVRTDGSDPELAPTELAPAANVTALAEILTSLGEGDVLFVDEIHRMPPASLAILQAAMDEQHVSLDIQDGESMRTIVLTLSAFTLLGATTAPSELPPRLRGRMGILIYLPPSKVEGRRALAEPAETESDGVLDEALVPEIESEVQGPGRPRVMRGERRIATRGPVRMRALGESPPHFKPSRGRHTCGARRYLAMLVRAASGRVV